MLVKASYRIYHDAKAADLDNLSMPVLAQRQIASQFCFCICSI